MPNQFTLQDCIDLATFAHRHQFDKAGEPYINHPKRVLASVQAVGAPAYVQMAAILHDVTEDTPFTCQMLVDLGVPVATVEVVKLVDRDYSKNLYRTMLDNRTSLIWSWQDLDVDEMKANLDAWETKSFGSTVHNADSFYYHQIKRSPGALIVKKADIGDNTQPWRLEYLDTDTQARLRSKYAKALEALS